MLHVADELRSLAPSQVSEAVVADARREILRLELRQRYQDAVRLLDDENWAGAADLLEVIVAADPEFEDAAALLRRARSTAAVEPAADPDPQLTTDTTTSDPSGQLTTEQSSPHHADGASASSTSLGADG